MVVVDVGVGAWTNVDGVGGAVVVVEGAALCLDELVGRTAGLLREEGEFFLPPNRDSATTTTTKIATTSDTAAMRLVLAE